MDLSGDFGGDVPLDLTEYRYGRTEALFLARVSLGTFKGWHIRKALPADLGRRLPQGRYAYCLLDVVWLAIMHDLVHAGVHADVVAEAARAATLAGAASTSPEANTDGIRPNATVVISFPKAGRPQITVHSIKSAAPYPPRRMSADPDADEPLRRSSVMIPATALFTDTVLRTQHLYRVRQREADDAAD